MSFKANSFLFFQVHCASCLLLQWEQHHLGALTSQTLREVLLAQTDNRKHYPCPTPVKALGWLHGFWPSARPRMRF